MQDQLTLEHPDLDIQILGINAIGHDAYNPLMMQGRDLPWMQDDATQDVWNRWGAAWRDVFIVDANNVTVDVVNLTTFDLSNAANYDDLMQRFVDAATPP